MNTETCIFKILSTPAACPARPSRWGWAPCYRVSVLGRACVDPEPARERKQHREGEVFPSEIYMCI